jgi:hypothetical protein
MSDQVIREPYDGIYYYADPEAESVVYRGNKYKLKVWRDTFARAKQVSGIWYPGYTSVVRKIPFRRGGLFAKGKGKKVIYRYGVYLRKKP